VKALSGGERNRLLLARLFTRPANVLVLDEPTNDLDLETLELLEEQLVEWPGTLLLVSHDRAFLDNVVTSTLVFEGDGRVGEYVGGYQDWLRQRISDKGGTSLPSDILQKRAGHPGDTAPDDKRKAVPPGSPPKKLSFNEQRELAGLPAVIEALEGEQRALAGRIASPDFYKEGRDAIRVSLARADEIESRLAALYARWDELDSRE
jgi:ATP-binding cassette subfamily F protein uup